MRTGVKDYFFEALGLSKHRQELTEDTPKTLKSTQIMWLKGERGESRWVYPV